MEAGIKQQLLRQCQAQLEARIETLQRSVKTIEAARDNETKSSAGDKFETGRAMMQMEADKALGQLEQAQYQLKQLKYLPQTGGPRAGVGSLVRTTKGHYFLSVSLGKAILEGQVYFCLSPQAPLAQQMLGKTVGETVIFKGQVEEILEVT